MRRGGLGRQLARLRRFRCLPRWGPWLHSSSWAARAHIQGQQLAGCGDPCHLPRPWRAVAAGAARLHMRQGGLWWELPRLRRLRSLLRRGLFWLAPQQQPGCQGARPAQQAGQRAEGPLCTPPGLCTAGWQCQGPTCAWPARKGPPRLCEKGGGPWRCTACQQPGLCLTAPATLHQSPAHLSLARRLSMQGPTVSCRPPRRSLVACRACGLFRSAMQGPCAAPAPRELTAGAGQSSGHLPRRGRLFCRIRWVAVSQRLYLLNPGRWHTELAGHAQACSSRAPGLGGAAAGAGRACWARWEASTSSTRASWANSVAVM